MAAMLHRRAMDFSPRPIANVAEELGLSANDYVPYGRGKAKLELSLLERAPTGKGRLILVTAINPTPAGEGKTTTSIGLAMGMRRLGKNAVLALREPSLGPVFGVKGGGTGGGKASLVPADDINLHSFSDAGFANTNNRPVLSIPNGVSGQYGNITLGGRP